MKLLAKVLKQDILLSALLTAPFIYIAALYFFSDSLEVYDASGHLALIWNLKENLWPAFWGWNATSLAGFDQGVYYPPLFHYAAAALSFFLGIENGVKLLVATAVVATPLSVYFLTSKIFTEAKARIFVASFILLVLVLAPGYLGVGLRSLTQIGLLTSFVATPILFFYLGMLFDEKRPSPLAQTLLLSLVLLTHFVAGLFCLLVLGSAILIKLLTRNFRRIYLLHLVLSLGLTSFFWLPFLLRWEYISTSTHLTSLSWINLGALIFSILLTLSFWKTRKYSLLTLGLVGSALSAIALADALLTRLWSDSTIFEKLYSLHLYRYQIYSYLIVTLLTFYWPTVFLFSLKKPRIKPIVVALLPFGVLLFLLGRATLQVSGEVEIRIHHTERGEGRFIETFTREESYPFVYSAQVKLIREQGQYWSYGLFTDATPNGPYLGSLVKTLTLKQSKPSTKFTVEDKPIDSGRIEETLDLFAIGNLLYRDIDQPEKVKGENFFSLKIADKSLVEIPKQELSFIQSNWDKRVFDWWFSKGEFEDLLVLGQQPLEVKNFVGSTRTPEIIKYNKGWSEFVVDTKSAEKVPVLVKFSYSPNWKAVDKQNREVKIYRASPSLMLIFAKGEVVFNYQTLWYQKLALLLSTACLFGIGLLRITKNNVFKI